MRTIFLSERLGFFPGWWRSVGRVSIKQLCSHAFLENVTPFVVRCFSSSNQHSLTVSYLINSCGLSPETAISASKRLRFGNPGKPDSVLALLRNHGCTDSHISKIVAKHSRVLLANPEKNLLPKLQFLCSAGLSLEDLPKVLVSNPSILDRSLEKTLIPIYTLLKGLVIGEENAMKALTKQVHFAYAKKTIAPNATLLREIGVPKEHISYLLTNYPALTKRSEDFRNAVKKVMAMGFDPEKIFFLNALQALCQMSESTWEQKMTACRSFGLSDDEIMLAFRSNPRCLQLSEKKIMRNMGYLVNMGWQPATVARKPTALTYNMEKRIIPRCSVMKLLFLKGLVKKDIGLGTFLDITEKAFMDRFILKYKEVFPQLLDVYHGKVGFEELKLSISTKQ